MRRLLAVAACAFALTLVAHAGGAEGPALQTSRAIPPRVGADLQVRPDQALIQTYCVTCHNQRLKTANLMLDTADAAHAGDNPELWEKVVRKLRGGMMPPPGVRRPDQPAVDALVARLEHALDEAAAARPNPGRVALHRLNRAEYAAAIDDLLAVTVDAAALLPKDDEADGFDNVANVLTVSPSFLEQYIAAARAVTNLALGPAAPRATSATYRPPRGTDQAHHVEGLPLGTRGGFAIEHLFPADGEYKLNIPGLAIAGYVRGMEYRHTVIVTIDGLKVFQQQIGGEEDLKAIDQQQAAAVAAINGRFQNIPLAVTAGTHRIVATFVARTFAESDDVLYSFRPGVGEDRIPKIASVEIVGPFNPAGISETASRRRVLVCKPASAADEVPCATRIFATLARKAFRRPVTEQDLRAPLQFFARGRQGQDFEAGIREAVPAILASPKFLYRAERTPAGEPAGGIHPLNSLELASRLSFFLSGRAPDEALLAAAEKSTLSDPRALDAQVKRLLAAPRASSLVTKFAFEWLKLRPLDDIEPDPVVFPNFDDGLRDAFKRELELFIGSVLLENRSVLDLLNADYTFVNERLALHYGIPGVRGSRFRRVTLADRNRWGLFGKGGVLLATSYANRTAPVLRGAWILENLMGTPPSPPPPDVEAFPENKDGEKARSVREIMEQHRAKPSCNACHGVMDPLGFALENFDAIGEWRDRDRYAGTAIDASGRLVDGTPVSGPADLRAALNRRPEQFVQTLTEKLMTYALGRSVEYYDMPVIRQIVRDAARDNYRFGTLVTGIVNSAPFRMRKAAESTE